MRANRHLRFVPPSLRDAVERLRAGDAQRCIAETDLPLRVYVDPLSRAGSKILATGHFEFETEAYLRDYLRQGQTFLDIGANEGILSAYAGTLVGPGGKIIAVEPQSRLRPFIEINMALNHVTGYFVYTNALGGEDKKTATLNLYPTRNHGQSSLVKKPKLVWTVFRRKTEKISFVSLERIMEETDVTSFDLVKVDVEGFEPEVVTALLPLTGDGAIQRLLLDYHKPVLAERGCEPAAIHEQLIRSGMTHAAGQGHVTGGYTVYACARRKKPH